MIEAGGAEIHHVDEGDGPVLLMLHGNPTWSFLYRGLIGRLRGRCRCVAPDLPGFGRSPSPSGFGFTPPEYARVIDAFVEKLDLGGITLMVHDWGGPIGLGVAGRRPDRFGGLVIANSWAWPVAGDPKYTAFSRALGGPLGWAAIMGANVFVNGGVPLGTRRVKPEPAVMTHYRGPFAERRRRRASWVLAREILRSGDYLAEVEAGLGSLRGLPALIVWGEKDPAFGARERRRFETAFPDHETLLLPDAGHFVQEDAGPEIAAAIDNWLPQGGWPAHSSGP